MDKLIRALVETIEIFVLYIEGMRIEWSVNMGERYTIVYKGEVCGDSSEEGLYNVINYYYQKDYTIIVKDGYVEMKKEE